MSSRDWVATGGTASGRPPDTSATPTSAAQTVAATTPPVRRRRTRRRRAPASTASASRSTVTVSARSLRTCTRSFVISGHRLAVVLEHEVVEVAEQRRPAAECGAQPLDPLGHLALDRALRAAQDLRGLPDREVLVEPQDQRR